MKKALLVIDLQEDYVGEKRNKKIFKYNSQELLEKINLKINESKEEGMVIYISNIFNNTLFNRVIFRYGIENTNGSKLVQGLNIISDVTFNKSKGNAFTNPSLVSFLKGNDVGELELVGVDGGGCVGLTAKGGAKLGFKINIINNCVGTAFTKRAEKLNKVLREIGVNFIN